MMYKERLVSGDFLLYQSHSRASSRYLGISNLVITVPADGLAQLRVTLSAFCAHQKNILDFKKKLFINCKLSF